MKLIIDISEEQYNDIVKHLTDNDGNYAYSDFNLREIIRNGIPLPKGHGRLIEENEDLFQSIRDWCSPDKAYEILKKAKTIIEADRGSNYENT